MRPLPILFSAACLLASQSAASCEPLTAARLSKAPDDPETFLVDGRYLRDEAAIARMRANGDLPDTIPDGRCRFEIAGDPGVVYYVRDCS